MGTNLCEQPHTHTELVTRRHLVGPIEAHAPDASTAPHPCRWKIRPDIGTALATCRAGELVLKIGQPDIVGPLIGADPDGMRVLIVGAIDQQTTHAGGAHLAEGDLLGAGHFCLF